jgi:hypothetical protein
MKSVMNTLADCEVYQGILVMKPLNQKVRPLLNDNVPDLWDILTLFQTIHHCGGWDTAGPRLFKTPLNLPHFWCKPERFIHSIGPFPKPQNPFSGFASYERRRWYPTCINHGGGVSDIYVVNIPLRLHLSWENTAHTRYLIHSSALCSRLITAPSGTISKVSWAGLIFRDDTYVNGRKWQYKEAAMHKRGEADRDGWTQRVMNSNTDFNNTVSVLKFVRFVNSEIR